MFRSCLKTAIRSLWKKKAYTAINIIGLATALGVCVLIVLYMFDELSYDRYNKNADRIYRLDADIFVSGTQFSGATSPKSLAETLVKDYPQVESMVRFNYTNGILVKKGNEYIRNLQSVFVDSTFFKVFSIPLVAGDASTALKEPNSIVVDESAAKKYFNSTDIIGKTLYVDNNVPCKVTGVMKDFPLPSHFHFSFLRPLYESYQSEDKDWINDNNLQSYIMVRPGIKREEAQALLDKTVNNYITTQLSQLSHSTADEFQKQGNHLRYHLRPLTDIHLHSDISFEFEVNGNITYVYIFSFVAALILLIACVNFMNLSTARSANRAKEVGIRKVAGSSKGMLILQFLIESVLLCLVSLFIAILVAMLLLPVFNELAGKQLQVSSLFSSWLLPVLLILVIVVGCIAGSYPAFYLSSFQPITVLKGKIASGFKSSWLRSTLVVFQFCISIVLIISTLIIYNQLSYIRNKEVGYHRERVVVLHNTSGLGNQVKALSQEIASLPGIENVTISGDMPTRGQGSYNEIEWFKEATLDAKKAIILTDFEVDENYIPSLGMQMIKGRNFSKEYKSDSTAIILNETAANSVGVLDALDIQLYSPNDNGKAIPYRVIGIVKDFNFSTMHQHVGPLVMHLGDNLGSIGILVNAKNLPISIARIENKWKSMAPGMPFSYSFMDNDFDKLYQPEKQTGKLFICFAIFAILIACLGLFGLVSYAAEQRTKEIGIRKVLGARPSGIVVLLTKDLLKLVLLACLIAFPVAWWAMDKWLQSFAYRSNIAIWVFAFAGAIAILIALLTVSLQTFRAAIANPVKSLKIDG